MRWPKHAFTKDIQLVKTSRSKKLETKAYSAVKSAQCSASELQLDQDLETKASQLINMKQMILQEQTKLNAIEATISDPMLRVDDNELEKLRIENE